MRGLSFKCMHSGLCTFYEYEKGFVELVVDNSFNASYVKLNKKQLEDMIEKAKITLENMDD